MQAPTRQPYPEVNMPAYGVNTPPMDATKPLATAVCKLSVSDLNFYYGDFQALKNISMEILANQVTAFNGPSGCGKSTFLRTLNRMNETVRGSRVEGQILLDGVNILEQEVAYVRRRVGMVFQRSNPFPKSIFDNIAYGPRINGTVTGRSALAEKVEQSLRRAALWEEVKDKLNASAYGLS